MRTPLLAALSAIAFATPAHAQGILGSIADALREEAAPVSGPARSIPSSSQSRQGYPDLDPTARRVGDRLCYAFIPIGAARTQDICIPTQNFADTLEPRPDMASQVFAGNTLDTDVEQLARCHIRRRDDPGIGSAPTEDPTKGYQFNLRCPSRREGGGHYDLSIAFNRDYYLPYRLSDAICGPDQAVTGSQFDQYVRSTLGEPTSVDERGSSVRVYHWGAAGTDLWLRRNEGSRSACDNPTSSQLNWTGRIGIADATWNAFLAYIEGLKQQQRDGSFNRF